MFGWIPAICQNLGMGGGTATAAAFTRGRLNPIYWVPRKKKPPELRKPPELKPPEPRREKRVIERARKGLKFRDIIEIPTISIESSWQVHHEPHSLIVASTIDLPMIAISSNAEAEFDPEFEQLPVFMTLDLKDQIKVLALACLDD